MNEVLNAIRIMKMYCWESLFKDVIMTARKSVHLQCYEIIIFVCVWNSQDPIYFNAFSFLLFLCQAICTQRTLSNRRLYEHGV